jgi:hypothetical protein
MGFIDRIHERQAEIAAQIDALVAERDENDAALRVFARLGANIESQSESNEGLSREVQSPTDGEADGVASRLNDGSGTVEAGDGQVDDLGIAEAMDEVSSAINSGLDDEPDNGSPAPGKSTSSKGFVAPRGEQIETTQRREAVAALHHQEPWLSPDEASIRLLMPVVNLRIFSQELDIAWSQPRPAVQAPAPGGAPKTLRDKVRAVHRMHPTWTARLIADHLGAPAASVSTYLAEARRVAAS